MSSLPVITSFPLRPLTKTFTPPSDCNGVYLSTVYMIAPSTTCLPPSASLQATQYFSPGLICPTGYASACFDTRGVKSITTVTCCPIVGDITLSCAPTDKNEIWSTLYCTWNPASVTSILVTLSEDSRTSSRSVPFTSPEGINAFGVRMVYQSTDLITSTSTSTSTSSSPSQTTSGGETTQPPTSTTSGISQPLTSNTPQVPPSSSTSSSGLSTGAKAAIGVVVPLAALAVLAALFFWWKRSREFKDRPIVPVTLTEYYQGKPYLNEAPGESRRSELAGEYAPIQHNELSELPDNNRR